MARGENLQVIRLASFFFTITILVTLRVGAVQNGKSDSVEVFVVKVAVDPETMAQENRFIDELGLALDTATVQVIDAPSADFREETLGEQIIWVKSILKDKNAVAGIWLAPASQDLLLLHMVVAKTNRTLVRMIQIESKEGFEADLALYARESLGEAFLLSDAKENPLIAKVVGEVLEKADKARVSPRVEPTVDKVTTPPKWNMLLAPVIEGNIAGGEGPPVLIGGSLALNWQATEGFGLRAGFAVIGGPFGSATGGAEISRLSLIPGFGAFYLWEVGILSLGPSIDIQAMYTHLTISPEETISSTTRHWRFRLGANLEARLRTSKHVSLFISMGVIALPVKDSYFGNETDTNYYSTSYLGWRSLIGLSLHP